MTNTVLHINASARTEGSTTRLLSAKVVDQLKPTHTITRDMQDALPQINEEWVGANFTPADQRSDAQRSILAQSDQLVTELQEADTVVIGVPIYNFSIPASLKAWVDLVARAGLTFKYTENGPVGLLEGKRAILVIASGGVPVDSPVDFVTGYLRQVMGFIGITDVTVIAADQMNMGAEAKLEAANAAIADLAA